MAETGNLRKNLFDLSRALGRWESEGGAPEPGQDLALPANEDHILRCLGAAVILQWNDLPTEIQRDLFADAAAMSDPARRSHLKQQIARFLHEHKDDT